MIPAAPHHKSTTQQHPRAGHDITNLAPAFGQSGARGETREQRVLLTTFGDATPCLVLTDDVLQRRNVVAE